MFVVIMRRNAAERSYDEEKSRRRDDAGSKIAHETTDALTLPGHARTPSGCKSGDIKRTIIKKAGISITGEAAPSSPPVGCAPASPSCASCWRARKEKMGAKWETSVFARTERVLRPELKLHTRRRP
jgi:hypothetical protein